MINFCSSQTGGIGWALLFLISIVGGTWLAERTKWTYVLPPALQLGYELATGMACRVISLEGLIVAFALGMLINFIIWINGFKRSD